MRKILGILFLVLSCAVSTFAQEYAYIYIEGDLQTPFYVKVEGKMQERLAKDYFIIPNLDAGYTNIEILFQQNEYPPQKFLLAIPKSGNRGFALHKINERQFALYDLQQKRYILSGNKKEDDWVNDSATAKETNDAVPVRTEQESLPPFEKMKIKKTEKAETAKQEERQEEQPRFLSGIELNNGKESDVSARMGNNAPKRTRRQYEPLKAKEDLKKLPAYNVDENGELVRNNSNALIRTDLPEIPNTDCPEAMDNMAFESLAMGFIDQSDDEKKIKYLRKNKKNQCFSTEQVRILSTNLETQSGRFEVVKMLYIQTSNQEEYGKLESLFNTQFLKTKFKELIQPK